MLTIEGARGREIYAANATALEAGLRVGDLISNARSKVTDLAIREAAPEADAAALARVALWCVRYTPCVSPWRGANGLDGLYLEVEGSAHLFGGEKGLIRDISGRFATVSLAPRVALADTPGTSWAVARFAAGRASIIPSGHEQEAIAPLPLAALRLPADTLALARRLGLRRIRDVMDKARAPLARRLGSPLILRLDQALGTVAEPLVPLIPPPEFHAAGTFVEPISTSEHILEAARRLLEPLTIDLIAKGQGLRRLRALLFALDGHVAEIEIGLAAPSRDARHLLRLLALKLDRTERSLETECGYEAMRLEARDTEPMAEVQTALEAGESTAAHGRFDELIDRLTQRLGPRAVHRLAPQQSHIPRRAVVKAAPLAPALWHADLAARATRPLVMLPRREKADVMALIPDGPPRQFRWRGVLHHVTRFEGPERISPEWWRIETPHDIAADCDYFAVEDTEGRRFWLARVGLYGEDPPPRWYVEGLFA